MFKKGIKMELSKQEMNYVTGGGISWGIVACVDAAVIYLIGCLGGITNPSRCSN
jgi:lactobin A/cerein 7B family class IIb bacteriocin